VSSHYVDKSRKVHFHVLSVVHCNVVGGTPPLDGKRLLSTWRIQKSQVDSCRLYIIYSFICLTVDIAQRCRADDVNVTLVVSSHYVDKSRKVHFHVLSVVHCNDVGGTLCKSDLDCCTL
jgi:hypothetical protein